MPKRTDLKKIMIIGSGPIVIGQAAEFDYAGTQACLSLKEEGYEVILVNSNPATIMTDPGLADRTYVEPITPEFVEKVIEKERPDALLPTLGGQTGLNTAVALAKSGILDKYGVEMVGCDLPAIERGVVRFIGSTTENPLVSMTPAIVSRCRIFQFYPLGEADVMLAMRRALADKERGFGSMRVQMDDDAMRHIARIANGDVRSALGALELAVLTTEPDENGVIHVTMEVAEESIQKPVIRCDESLYYDMLSAFCKSLRGSDADAAMAWFARLLYAGVDPRLIARRIIAHASEDVGLANPTAMLQAVAASQALEAVGLPEARLSMAQAIIAICEN